MVPKTVQERTKAIFDIEEIENANAPARHAQQEAESRKNRAIGELFVESQNRAYERKQAADLIAQGRAKDKAAATTPPEETPEDAT